MLSNAIVAAFIVALVMTTVVPAVLLLILGLCRKISVRPLLTGTAGFMAAWMVQQALTGVIAAQAFGESLPTPLPFWYMAVNALIAALLGGGVLFGSAFALRHNRKFKDVMSVGLGYGMAETVLIVGLNQITNVRLALVAHGGADALTAKWPDIDAQAVLDVFQSTPVSEIYLGVVERISLTVFYLFVALLLYQGVVHRRPLTVFVGFGAYMLFTFAGNLAVRYAGRWTAEMVMLVMAAASGVYVLFQARRAKERRAANEARKAAAQAAAPAEGE